MFTIPFHCQSFFDNDNGFFYNVDQYMEINVNILTMVVARLNGSVNDESQDHNQQMTKETEK